MVTSAPVLLYQWDHFRRPCSRPACRQSVLWPVDEPNDPVCERCWDREASEAVEASRFVLNADQAAFVIAEMERIRALPRGIRGPLVEALARRMGVTSRTMYRHARYTELVPVEVFGHQAMFGLSWSDPSRPIRRSPWVSV